MAITIGTIDSIAKELKAMPEVANHDRQVSKQEAVRLLAKEILALQRKGYTLEQVAQVLTAKGIPVSNATLKNYLQRNRTAKPKAKPREQPPVASADRHAP